MPSCGLYLAAAVAVLLAAIAAVAPQAQTVKAVPGSSVRVECGGSSASGGDGGGWSLLGALSNLLLGDGDDDDDDEDVDGSSDEQRADSEEDDYWWLDGDSSEEAARREPAPPVPLPPPGPGDVANNSLRLPLPRYRRATPSWGLGDVGVQAGKNWSVRVFNWMLVRRDPTTDRVEVKLLMPNLFSSGDTDGGRDIDNSSGARGERVTPKASGDIDVQGGKNWSVRVFDWVLVRRNPATGQVEVNMQVPGLFSPAGGGDEDIDYVDVSDRGRGARSARFGAGAA